MPENQLRRHYAFGQQTLWSVKVGQKRVQQARSLCESAFDEAPLAISQNEGNGVQRPGAIGALGVRINVVGDAILDDQTLREVERAARRSARIHARDAIYEMSPMRAKLPGALQELVIAARLGAITRQTSVCRGFGPGGGHG
jgi:hypothetical protein